MAGTTKAELKTHGVKYDTEKNRLDLLDIEWMEEVGKVLTYGAIKYSPDNWRIGISYRRLIGAALRHLFAFARGEDFDPETGLSHLSHASCCIMFLFSHQKYQRDLDDRVIDGKIPKEVG